MVDKERTKLLVNGLRSGRFPQISAQLGIAEDTVAFEVGGFCCLGVACEVAIENGLEISKTINADGVISYDGSAEILPESVKAWYGFDDTNPKLCEIKYSTGEINEIDATEANDEKSWDFQQIALAFEQWYVYEDHTPIPVEDEYDV